MFYQAQGKTHVKRYAEIIDRVHEKVETRSADEIIDDVVKKTGITIVKEDNE